MRIASVGHAVFAAVMIAVGILGLVRGEFIGVWDGVPNNLPAREMLPYLCAGVALISGLGLFWQRTAALAARVLFVYLLLWLLLFKGRYIVLQPNVEVSYESSGETAVIVAAAWVLYSWFAADWDRRWLGFMVGDKGVRYARVLLGLALIAFGFSHFAYLENTASLVPGWLPGHVFWAYFFGSTYLAAGVAMLIGVYARLAAVLTAVQIAMFTLLIWVPIVAVRHVSADNWGEFAVSCALTAGAWVVADSYRGMPWLAVNKR
ncbi:MAG TPA: DoxX family membrane protein [Gammaproteobacteria bacterium]|jgi:uncharacterized membrane protein|nr:DoxX family membrane protein [Gammaproteobacteria bacterium]